MPTATTNWFRRPAILLALVAVLVTAAAYGWVLLYGSFFSDDFTWLWHGQKIGLDLGKMWSFKMSSFFSPTVNAYWAVLLAAVGPSAPWYFGVDLAVHAAVAWFAGLLALRLGGSRPEAALVTVSIAVAGAAFEPVIWVASNMHSLTALFVLVAVHAYLSFLRHGRMWAAVLTVIAVGLAYMTKETSIVVVTLLFGLAVMERRAPHFRQRRHLVLAASVAVISAAYVLMQLQLQRDSMTVNAGLWKPTPAELLRLPIVIADHVMPTAWLRPLHRGLLAIAGAAVFAVALWRRRLSPAIAFGLYWGVLASLPTIFFQVEGPWMPLSSRYGYLPRVGTVMAFVLVVFSLVGRRRRTWAAAAVIAVIAAEASFAAIEFHADYPYVYATGRTLTAALEQARDSGITHLYVLPNRPFESNEAHLVGATSVLIDMPEEQLIFMKKGETLPPLTDHAAALKWNAEAREYRLVK
jgi:hypothetical protein